MQWKKESNGDWIAQGEKGHFLLWKLKGRKGWFGLYMVEFGNVVKFRLYDKSLKELKKKCEENYYWEA